MQECRFRVKCQHGGTPKRRTHEDSISYRFSHPDGSAIDPDVPDGPSRDRHPVRYLENSQTQGRRFKTRLGKPSRSYLYRCKEDSGIAEQWNVELGSPGAIIVSGLSRELLSPGTTLTITGYPGKTNSTTSTDALDLRDTRDTGRREYCNDLLSASR